MKKAGIGAVLGLTIFAGTQSVALALPQQGIVVIPYFSTAIGMFTAISYVYHDADPNTPPAVHFTYTYKSDLTQNLNQPCAHYDGVIETTNYDLDTILVDGAAPDVKQAVFVDDAGNDGIAPITTGEGFVALMANNNDRLVAEAHVIVAPTRGVFSFRAIQINGADNTFIDNDTIAPGENTTVMFFPESIAETYVYMIADGASVIDTRPYDVLRNIEIVHHDGMGIFNRSEQGRSAGGLNKFNCAAVVHIRDILGDAAYNFSKDTGGWFSLGVPAGEAAGVIAYKIELSASYGATVTPLHSQTYAR